MVGLTFVIGVYRGSVVGLDPSGSSSYAQRTVSQDERHQSRSLFRRLLELIGDLDQQRQYKRDVPIANVPAELICMWFDDHYRPDQAWFPEAFSSRERLTLADFSAFYEERLSMLPTQEGIKTLQATPEWAEIREKARLALAELDSD